MLHSVSVFANMKPESEITIFRDRKNKESFDRWHYHSCNVIESDVTLSEIA